MKNMPQIACGNINKKKERELLNTAKKSIMPDFMKKYPPGELKSFVKISYNQGKKMIERGNAL